MASKKRKRLNVRIVEQELRLMAAGACGCEVDITSDPVSYNIIRFMTLDAIEMLCDAIYDRYFRHCDFTQVGTFHLTHVSDWQDFPTLAKSVVSERARLDNIPEKQQ